MTLAASGSPISIRQIQTEYGGSNPASLSEYYRGGNLVGVDSGISITRFQKICQNSSRLPDNIDDVWANNEITATRYSVGYLQYAVDVYVKGYLYLKVDGSGLVQQTSGGASGEFGFGKSISIHFNSTISTYQMIIASDQAVYLISLNSGQLVSRIDIYRSNYSNLPNSIKFVANDQFVIGWGSGTYREVQIRSTTGAVVATIAAPAGSSRFGENLVTGVDKSNYGQGSGLWATTAYDPNYTYLYVYYQSTFKYKLAMTNGILSNHFLPISIRDDKLYMVYTNISSGIQFNTYDVNTGNLLDATFPNQTYSWVNIDFGSVLGHAISYYSTAESAYKVDVYKPGSSAPYWSFNTQTDSPPDYFYGAVVNSNSLEELTCLGLRSASYNSRILYRVSYPYPEISMSQYSGTTQTPVTVTQLPDLIIGTPATAPIMVMLTGSGTYTVPTGTSYNRMRVIAVGGGGAGGSVGGSTGAWDGGGGGGAGGLIDSTMTVSAGQSFTYSVGAGGAGALGFAGSQGSPTRFDTLTAYGGGGGGGFWDPYQPTSIHFNGFDGGSGGGATGYFGPRSGGASTAGQGNAGGTSADEFNSSGGGAGGPGTNAVAGSGGSTAGPGLYKSTPLYAVVLAGGGGHGGSFNNRDNATVAGGLGGGGAGGVNGGTGTNGTPDTGGGGGGGGGRYPDGGGIGGPGGSGVIYLYLYTA